MKAVKILLVLGTFLISTAFAGNQAISRRPHKRPPTLFSQIELFSDQLGLTEEQQVKIKEQKFNTDKEAIQLRSKIQIAELELRNLLQSDDPDEEEIKNKIEEIGKLKTELRFILVKRELEIRNTLTSEQMEKLQSLTREHFKQQLHRPPALLDRRSRRQFRGYDNLSEPESDFDTDFGDDENDFLEI